MINFSLIKIIVFYFVWRVRRLTAGLLLYLFLYDAENCHRFFANLNMKLPDWFDCKSARSELTQYCDKKQNLALRNLQFEIYWRNKTADFSAQNRRTVNYVDAEVAEGEFSFSLDIQSPVTILRVDFPDLKGMMYSLHEVKVETENGVQDVDMNVVAFRHSVQKKTGHLFLVTGDDPYVGFSLSKGNIMVKNVVVHGRVQTQ